jgi:hypothetical protein
MKPVHNWRAILKHAWSIRLDLLNIAFTVLLGVVPILMGTAIVSPLALAIVSAVATAGSMGVRLIKQEKVSGPDEPSP